MKASSGHIFKRDRTNRHARREGLPHKNPALLCRIRWAGDPG